jgi:hypothetical protein
MTNRAGMVRRATDRPKAIGARGGLGEAGFRAWRSTRARDQRRRKRSMRGGCARCIDPLHDRVERHLVTRGRAQRLSMESPALRWCAWMRRTMCRPLSGRGRVECRYRLTCCRRILRLRPFQPFRSWVLLAVGPQGSGSKRSTGPTAVVEEWRSIATGDDPKLRALASPVKHFVHFVQSHRMSRPDFNLAVRLVFK